MVNDNFYDELFAGIEEEVEKQMATQRGTRRRSAVSVPVETENSKGEGNEPFQVRQISEAVDNGVDTSNNDFFQETVRNTSTPVSNRTSVNPIQKQETHSEPIPTSPKATFVNPTASTIQKPVSPSKPTMINSETVKSSGQPSSRTFVNPHQNYHPDTSTMVNPRYKPSGTTQLNPKEGNPDQFVPNDNHVSLTPGTELNLTPGDQLLNDSHTAIYTVISRLGQAADSGESDVFICSKDNIPYVVKIFRREMRVKPQLINKLKNLNSDLVAKIIDIGTYEGRYFEVYNYYDAGSLADEVKIRDFSYSELKSVIIPSLNEGLHALHQAQILHRDIKPSNILWKDKNKNSIVLIDFGIASVVRDSSLSIVVSQVGFTQVYAAPEVIRGHYYDESDYYSMGIVLYELCCRKLPFSTPDEAGSFLITQPAGMPDDLYNLILGLTYYDISRRDDKSNPNRRWTYDEVCDWLNEKPHPVPGSVQVMPSNNLSDAGNERTINPISFNEHIFHDIDSLCKAMGTDWNAGRQLLMRGTLLAHLQRASGSNVMNQHLWASQIDDVMNSSAYVSSDQRLLRVINLISSDRNYVACPLGCYEDLKDLGEKLFTAMESTSSDVQELVSNTLRLLLDTHTLSEFMEQNNNKYQSNQISHMKQLENIESDRLNRQISSIAYELAYFLSGRTELGMDLPDHPSINSIDDLKCYLSKYATGDFKELYRICGFLLNNSLTMKPRLYGWMVSQGADVSRFNQ